MPCWSPVKILNRNRKSGSEFLSEVVPCGKCLGCLSTKRSGWAFRLLQETKVSSSATFLTLTYNDEHLKYKEKYNDYRHIKPVCVKKDLQKYFKRVRRKCPNLKYYGVGEYGSENFRPHFHAIVFNASNEVLNEKWTEKKDPIGFVRCDPCNEATIHYTTKYIINEESKNSEYQPFAIMSNGLGKEYINVAKEYHKKNQSFTTYNPGGVPVYLPRYYRDQIFNEEERKIITERKKSEMLNQMEKSDYKSVLSNRRYKKVNAVKQSKSKKV